MDSPVCESVMSTAKIPPFGLGAPLRPFRLPEPLTGRLLGPEDFPAARALLVAFICNASPAVQHVAGALAALTRDLEPRGLRALAVNAAPDEAPADVAAETLRHGYVFPYLIDQTRAVARGYGSVHTPDFYVFDRSRRLAYHGRFDALRAALAQALKGQPRRRTSDPAH